MLWPCVWSEGIARCNLKLATRWKWEANLTLQQLYHEYSRARRLMGPWISPNAVAEKNTCCCLRFFSLQFSVQWGLMSSAWCQAVSLWMITYQLSVKLTGIDTSHLGCNTVSFHEQFSTLWRNVLPLSSGWSSSRKLLDPENEGSKNLQMIRNYSPNKKGHVLGNLNHQRHCHQNLQAHISSPARQHQQQTK